MMPVVRQRAEAAEGGQSLSRAAPSPWWQHSAAELGLGAPVVMELAEGDAMVVDYRTFRRGGANVSSKLRAQLLRTACDSERRAMISVMPYLASEPEPRSPSPGVRGGTGTGGGAQGD